MANTDHRNLPLSTCSFSAAEHYKTGVDLLLSLWPGAIEELDLAIQQDTDFALAYAARARLHAIHARLAQAKIDIAHAEALVLLNGTQRERSHVSALSLAINGRGADALTASLSHLESWPQDVLIFGLPLGAFGLFAFSGMANHDQARVDLCERHSKHFAVDDWWFLTYRGWSHTENGNVLLGRKLTERALQIRRANGNAAHAMAHALYECGANSEAQEMIADWLPDYDRRGVLHGHIAWHGALIALEQGDIVRALGYYTSNVAPLFSAGTPINIVSDSASFLWRLEAYGYEVPPPLWSEAAAYASSHFQQPGFAFADFHMSIIDAHTGNQPMIDRRQHSLLQANRNAPSPAGSVNLELCLAIQAFANGSFAECARILEPLILDVARIGGSGAQRELVDDMLVVSLMKAGQINEARTILSRRLHRRPSARDTRWLNDLSGK